MDQRYTDEIEPRLGAMDMPVQVLWGADDAWLPLVQGHRLAERLTGRPAEVVAGAGHLMQEDRPEAIVAAMARFAR